MTFDTHSTLGYSTVVTIVSQSASTLVVDVVAGEGSRFATGQQVTIWASGQNATLDNAMIGRITGISTDELTIDVSSTNREGTSTRTVLENDQIANTVTPKALTDIEELQKIVTNITSSATPTPAIASRATQLNITALAVAALLTNPTGTPQGGDTLIVRIKDNGTAHALTYDTEYRAIGVTLPPTTVVGKTTYLGCIRNSADTKWDCVAVAQEA